MSSRYKDNFWGWARSITDRVPVKFICLAIVLSCLADKYGMDMVVKAIHASRATTLSWIILAFLAVLFVFLRWKLARKLPKILRGVSYKVGNDNERSDDEENDDKEED